MKLEYLAKWTVLESCDYGDPKNAQGCFSSFGKAQYHRQYFLQRLTVLELNKNILLWNEHFRPRLVIHRPIWKGSQQD